MTPPIDRDFLIRSLVDLVRINSVNPDLVPGAPGEAEIATYVAQTLRGLGIPTSVHALAPGRLNVISKLEGTGDGRSLMLNGHLDTVGVDGMRDPFAAEIRDGKLYGRGAQDMKGSVAAILATAKALVESGTKLSGDLVLTFVADEEHGSIGTEHVVTQVKTDGAIVAEPTNLDICLAHRGFWVFEFETEGRAAHGGSPDQGIDANMHMGRVLAELDRLSQALRTGPAHELVGRPSLHVPLLNGGDQLYIYASQCKMSVERRTIPGDTDEAVRNEMRQIVERLSADDPQFKASVRPVIGRQPFEVPRDAKIVNVLLNAASQITGRTPNFIGHEWWEDSALLAENGTETVIFGPRGAGIHSTEEWVDIASVVQLAEILRETVVAYCA